MRRLIFCMRSLSCKGLLRFNDGKSQVVMLISALLLWLKISANSEWMCPSCLLLPQVLLPHYLSSRRATLVTFKLCYVMLKHTSKNNKDSLKTGGSSIPPSFPPPTFPIGPQTMYIVLSDNITAVCCLLTNLFRKKSCNSVPAWAACDKSIAGS